jgi:hypothetical protein
MQPALSVRARTSLRAVLSTLQDSAGHGVCGTCRYRQAALYQGRRRGCPGLPVLPLCLKTKKLFSCGGGVVYFSLHVEELCACIPGRGYICSTGALGADEDTSESTGAAATGRNVRVEQAVCGELARSPAQETSMEKVNKSRFFCQVWFWFSCFIVVKRSRDRV